MKVVICVVYIVLSLTSACSNPVENKTKAIISDSNSADVKMQNEGEPVNFSGETSTLEFGASKITGQQEGGFKTFSGLIDLVNNQPEGSQVSVNIDMASVFTDADGLTSHLKTADFFDVGNYPHATFVSTNISPDKDNKAATFLVTGELEFHGVKKSITFPATIVVSPDSVRVEAEFFFNRREFNVNYQGRANDLIRDEVILRFRVLARRKM